MSQTVPPTSSPVGALLRAVQERRPDWMTRANCRGVDPALFFPGRGERAELEAARDVCRGCAVRDECLAYALALPAQKHGVWGGLSERERRQLRRQRRAARAVRLDGAA